MKRPAMTRAAMNGALLSALLAGISLAAGCTDRGQPGTDGGEVMSSPEHVSRDFVVTRSLGGVKKWNLKAEEGKLYDGGDLVLLTALTLDFFDSTGAPEGTLTAARGRALRAENRIEVQSDVVLRTAEGGELRTDSLVWSEATDRITTDAYVEIDRDGERLTGFGLEATPDLTFAEVKREVTVSGTREER
jgi:LPS export ABC transporter protein LptC